jgi:hypothetical protein
VAEASITRFSTGVPNLVLLTEHDTDWNWNVCICCGSDEVTHRAFWIRTNRDGVWEINRVAWCGNDDAEARSEDGERWGCQGDRRRAVNVIYVAADGFTRPSTEQHELFPEVSP